MTLFLLVNIALDGAAASAGALALLESANQSGKRTIVTRATSGLGLETALDLVRNIAGGPGRHVCYPRGGNL